VVSRTDTPHVLAPVDGAAFRQALGMFATGVTVVTTVHDDVLHGMTANAFASVSLEPPLVLVCVDKSSGMHELLPRSRCFAVTVLGEGQEELSLFFASSRRPQGRGQFAEVDWRPAPVTGSPVLDGGIAFVDCRVVEVHEGGDHSIFLAEVLDLGVPAPEAQPLLYFGGAYRRLTGPEAPSGDSR
jgi:flavin reductase